MSAQPKGGRIPTAIATPILPCNLYQGCRKLDIQISTTTTEYLLESYKTAPNSTKIPNLIATTRLKSQQAAADPTKATGERGNRSLRVEAVERPYAPRQRLPAEPSTTEQSADGGGDGRVLPESARGEVMGRLPALRYVGYLEARGTFESAKTTRTTTSAVTRTPGSVPSRLPSLASSLTGLRLRTSLRLRLHRNTPSEFFLRVQFIS